MSFGQLLRQRRIAAGLTQEALATAAGLSTRSVSDLERGVNQTARKETARLLADALKLTGQARSEFELAARGGGSADGVAAATRTLPRDVRGFTGREAELRRLIAAASGGRGAQIAFTIGGMAGVGKTAFAVHAAHQLVPWFPDGQVFLPLHGHTPGQRPVDPADALASLLQTIGITAPQIPLATSARVALWRDQLAGKQILLLLDDAADSDQVKPLIPSSAGSLVLVTSRRHLTALDAQVISLDTLPPAEAAWMLVGLAARPGLEPGDPAVAEITRLSGYLPLALGMLARQLHHHPAWSARDLAADLAASRDRLELMHAENLSVAAAFDLSYQDLTEGQQRMFRRLGLHTGADIDAHAAAALAGTAVAAAGRDLEGLYGQYLITEPIRGRYRLHDLIREHARSLAAAELAAEREAAAGRLIEYYARAVRAAAGQLAGPEREAAVSWLAAERLNLHAAALQARDIGRPAQAVAIAAAMHGFLRGQGHWDQALALHQAASEAARLAGGGLAEARARSDLGETQYLIDDYPAAADSLGRALELYRGLGDRLGEAGALIGLGAVRLATGDYPAAAASFGRALELYRGLGDRLGEAGALTELGTLQQKTGDYLAAAASFTFALELYRELGDRPGEARASTELGTVQQDTGDYPAAAASQQLALGLYRGLGDRLGEANALTDLGTVQCRTGDYPAASASLGQALELYREIGDLSGAAEALNTMGELALASGASPGVALARYQAARAIAASISAPFDEARALDGIGRCYLRAGRSEQGAEMLRRALAILERIGSPNARLVAETLREYGL